MDAHGGLPPALIRDEKRRLCAPERDSSKNFRNFIRPPCADEKFRIFSQDPRKIPEKADALFRKLGMLMHNADTFGEVWRTHETAGLKAWENPAIPSGYTYLLQLIAHDLVLSSEFVPGPRGAKSELRNHRSFALDLDTLYGPGPAACPLAYATDDNSGFSTRLRLGRMAEPPSHVRGTDQALRDIARGRALPDNSQETYDTALQPAPEALIADPRNDASAMLSQTLTLFIWLHNTAIRKTTNIIPDSDPQPGDRQRRFSLARQFVVNSYNNIIAEDLMPRVMGPNVLEAYRKSGKPIFDRNNDGRMPLEFSHAVMRFGHTMIRESYTFNTAPNTHDILVAVETNSTQRPTDVPLDRRWIIQWPRFFDFGDRNLKNYSRRIGPSFAMGLMGFESIAPHTVGHRDLMRGGFADLWSVKALIKEIESISGEIIAASPLLSDFPAASKKIEAWLKRFNPGHGLGLSECEIQTVADDPPLYFFILFEAMEECAGTHLGTLGSIIFAETILHHLTFEKILSLDTEMQKLGLKKIVSMKDLIETVSRENGINMTEVDFFEERA